jgi:hypothetical protein
MAALGLKVDELKMSERAVVYWQPIFVGAIRKVAAGISSPQKWSINNVSPSLTCANISEILAGINMVKARLLQHHHDITVLVCALTVTRIAIGDTTQRVLVSLQIANYQHITSQDMLNNT